MATLNTQISALLATGADAMDNLFDVDITLPDAILAVTPAGRIPFGLRCLGFEPPKFTLKTYDAPYKTMKIKRSAGKIEGDRSFKLQFRLDAYYQIYRLLLAWRDAVMQPATGYASSGINKGDSEGNSFYGQVAVAAADSPIAQPKSVDGYKVQGVTQDVIVGSQSMSSGLTASLNWRFLNVWVMDVDNPKFVTGSGEIQLITATFGFGSYQDPQIFDKEFGLSGHYNNIIPK